MKIVQLILLGFILVSGTPALSVGDLDPNLICDADRNGQINVNDSLRASRIYSGTLPNESLCDANLDGRVTILDSLLIAQYSVGLPPRMYNHCGQEDISNSAIKIVTPQLASCGQWSTQLGGALAVPSNHIIMPLLIPGGVPGDFAIASYYIAANAFPPAVSTKVGRLLLYLNDPLDPTRRILAFAITNFPIYLGVVPAGVATGVVAGSGHAVSYEPNGIPYVLGETGVQMWLFSQSVDDAQTGINDSYFCRSGSDLYGRTWLTTWQTDPPPIGRHKVLKEFLIHLRVST